MLPIIGVLALLSFAGAWVLPFVFPLQRAAHVHLALAVGDLRDDCGDHCASRLAWSVGVEWSDDSDRSIKGSKEGQGHLIRTNFCG